MNAALATVTAVRATSIQFDCGGPITIDVSASGAKVIRGGVVIDGGGTVTLSGGGASGVFEVTSGAGLVLQGVTLRAGTTLGSGAAVFCDGGQLGIFDSRIADSAAGAGIYARECDVAIGRSTLSGNSDRGISCLRGTLAIDRALFEDNQAQNVGAAISSDRCEVTVANSTFRRNVAAVAGGIANVRGNLSIANSTFSDNVGGAIVNSDQLTVVNSTFVGNDGGTGSTVALGGISNAGTMTVINSTIVANASGLVSTTAAAVVQNTIVAENTVANCEGSITDGGHNLEDGATCGFSSSTASLPNTDPRLDPAGLRDNGGPSQTIALCLAVDQPAGCTAASPAIGAGDQAICETAVVGNRDQRGFGRPGIGLDRCTIGAYEATVGCVGDCDDDKGVRVDEVVRLVSAALGSGEAGCVHGLVAGARIDVVTIVVALNNALHGCGTSN